MPIYEYACRSCEHRFEELVSSYGTLVACPQCTSGEVEKLLSTFTARTAGGAPALRRPRCGRRAAAAGAAAAAAGTDAVSAPDLAAEWAGCTICALPPRARRSSPARARCRPS